ncbi:MAG: hypothetical protein UU74_C0019G0024 [Candidatus Woesebacteria bacterium GW2011_GWA1_41_7]|uniref:Uncharacterized protein n=1 Tax=Candidatus Woesebacteria bacterium GW2011_GWA1_41_7 TaxID=1618556 RepID=A0A0G0ZXA0_9BACT|nr:MAG: hypothetical protein UU74_C0019G0024 [Candidatus Woesebacteria bacterium GW2011_GWA1_41_7]
MESQYDHKKYEAKIYDKWEESPQGQLRQDFMNKWMNKWLGEFYYR